VEAVSAAHSAGVVHMDLKPTNILLAPGTEGGWQVRVVDFGSGRSLDRAAVDKLDVQRLGLSVTQVVEGRAGSGTADYMAPEVRQGTETVLPVLCDVYALGVLLYQLLAGDLRKPLAPGWERDIADPFLREDIAAATDGNPANRLQSASALGQRLTDLDARHTAKERALAQARQDEADRAQAQADRERRRQFEARRPWALAAMALLVLGLGASLLLWRQADGAKARAEASAEQAAAVTRFLNDDVLGQADPYGDTEALPAMKAMLRRTLSHADHAFAGQPRTEAAVRETLAGLLDKYDDAKGAETQWRAAIALLTRLDGAAAPNTLRARYRLGAVIARVGRFEEAEAWLKQVDDDAAVAGVADARTGALGQFAWGLLYLTWQRQDKAAAPYAKALTLAQQASQPDQALLDNIRHGLATAYSGLGNFQAAARVSEEQLASYRARPGVGELRLAQGQYDLGQALMYQGQLDEAEPLLETAAKVTANHLGSGSPSSVMTQTLFCDLLSRRKQNERALACVIALRQAMQSSPTAPPWMTWYILGNVGLVQSELQRYEEARSSLEEARTHLIAEKGPPVTVQYVGLNLALVRWRLALAASALPLTEGVDPTALLSLDPDVPWPQHIALLRGLILAALGRRQEARALLEPAMNQLAQLPLKTPESLQAEAQTVLAQLR